MTMPYSWVDSRVLAKMSVTLGFLYFFALGMLLNDFISSLILRSVGIFLNRENPFFSVNPMGEF